MPRIVAIIPTLSNTKGLFHLLKELHAAKIPAVVVDNNPTEEKSSLLQEDPNSVIYLPQDKNTFFAKAINLGSHAIHTDWLLIANDDIEGVTEEKMNSLVNYAEKHDWIAVSPVLVNPQRKVENIGYQVLPIGKAVLNFDKSVNTDMCLDGLTAACLLIKQDVFEKIGGFDESFVAYLEDVDLFLRLKKAGYHFGIMTDIQAIHSHMTTSSKMIGFKQKRDMINWWKIVWKNWDTNMWLNNFPGIMIERLKNLSGLMKTYW